MMKKFPYIVLATSLFAGPALADSPREFLTDALRGDNSEIMLGQLAQQRGSSRAVRSFGTALVTDHTKARNEVLAVGRSYGIKSDRRTMPEANEEKSKLSRMRGDEFDREFARYMVEDHEKDIGNFRDEANEHHGRVSDLAQKQLPALEKHLRMAQEIDHDRDLNDHNLQRRR